MPKHIRIYHLTNKEEDILNILWDSSHPITATDIVKFDSRFTVKTTQTILKKLLKKDLIEVADIVYSGTILCHNYRPTITANEFALSQFTTEYNNLKEDISSFNLVGALLDSKENQDLHVSEINELDQLLAEYKKSCLESIKDQERKYD